jgi:hypothetical protein
MLLIDNDQELHKKISMDLFINNAGEAAKRIVDLEEIFNKKQGNIISQKEFDLEFEYILLDALVYAGRVLDAVDTMEELVDEKEVSENE